MHERGLVDTSVLIELESIGPDALPNEVAVSAVSFAELAAGPHATPTTLLAWGTWCRSSTWESHRTPDGRCAVAPPDNSNGWGLSAPHRADR